MNLIFVDHIDEVFKIALREEKKEVENQESES
jgi:ATP-dependent Lon protease